MSEQQLVNIIREQLDEEADTSSPRPRIFKTAKKGNNIFAENIGRSIYEYLDTVYFERITKYVEETYEERIKRLEDKVVSLMATLQPTYHGTKIFVYGPTASTSIDLAAQFPLMGLVTGNVWAVFGKYCGFLAGAAEAREFYISRNSSGTWSSAQFGPSAATGASLASVGGSGVNLEILTTTNSYFTLELTVMIR
jgi:hypothetical protein